ncbi:MAG: hypothetical protein D4R64_09270 [Porphyromonadaceae bacterium]|nr:MAG: hypothetical protein D4R64_09270 [Porphyromonadaceae bacterium]
MGFSFYFMTFGVMIGIYALITRTRVVIRHLRTSKPIWREVLFNLVIYTILIGYTIFYGIEVSKYFH